MSISQTHKIGQIALEFLLMAGLSMMVILVLLIIVVNISVANTESRTYDDVVDFGKSLQQEFILASELENGYIRELDIPNTINGQSYNISIYNSNASKNFTYIVIDYLDQETYYSIPLVTGQFTKGTANYIHKNNTLYLT